MQLPQYALGEVPLPVLPTRRAIGKARKRLVSRQRPYLLRWFLAFAAIVAIGFYISHRESDGAVQPSRRTPAVSGNGLAGCFRSPVSTLVSFDPFVLSEKKLGLVENDFENRFQEDLWDTLIDTYSFFPAWSDMRWNVPQYARSLAQDLAIAQSIAASVVGLTFHKSLSKIPPFGSPESSVRVSYAYHRLDRMRGLQYVVNFAPRSRVSNPTAYNVLIEKPIDHPECRVSLASSQTSDPVYILLPYKARAERLRLFLQNYRYLRTQHNENLVLIISVLRDATEDLQDVVSTKAEVFGADAAGASSVWVHKNSGDVENSFSRAVALREATKVVPDADSVMFHCDVDMLILPAFFDRCRHNTILGSQVYYPVFYSLYPYASKRPSIAERNGFWRKTSFGMTCIRKGDFQAVGAYDDAETRFHGWGSEDVYQFEQIRNTSNLVAFRAVEPLLMHRWHSKKCDKTSEAYVDCMKTNFATMGHPLKIGPVLLDALEDVDQFMEKLRDA